MTDPVSAAPAPRIRILICIDEMEVGGTQQQVVELLNGLDQSHFEPTLCFFRTTSELVARVQALGIDVIQIEKRSKVDLRFLKQLAQLLKQKQFHVVHAFSLTAEIWIAVANMIAHFPGKSTPLVSSVRGWFQWYTKLHWFLKKFVSWQSQLVVSNSKAGAENAAAHAGVALSKFKVIPNGLQAPSILSNQQRLQIRQSLGLADGAAVFIFVGRLVNDKNVPSLLRALERLREKNVPCQTLIVGSGPLLAELQEQASQAQLQQCVTFLGERQDAIELMQIATALVLPSFEEGLSNALIEAMSVGIPVIASAVGGNTELIEHGQNGFLYPSDDDAKLANQLERVVADSELVTTLGARAKLRFKAHYSAAEMVRAYAEVYESCVSKPVK